MRPGLAVLLLVAVVAVAGCTGSSGTTRSDHDGGSTQLYFQHTSTCGGGTCGTPLETGFEVSPLATRLWLQISIASGATGAVRIDLRDPDGASVYSKTLTPASSQTTSETTIVKAEHGRWTYSETYAAFNGVVSVTVTEASR